MLSAQREETEGTAYMTLLDEDFSREWGTGASRCLVQAPGLAKFFGILLQEAV